ncbi:DNA-binding transcriptional regulator, MurR/RpiR family, contains HTH and SIS domains [Sinosporangium album]|uniref:DNA-binding transcriptional regulator, MurR/RpiR family, contains HTH and SIS domains n=1 Tax=Sinosporangium album TaxID=504805 RepID=A0A1G7SXY5_9ACTN|nr:MurR/RpiR family transcriptional regulator [Sinosporangium album]SDG27923.1 DNA-binding transcriptional regulator, MurR/RpiR family, contains HTH and SIS domains [Sinosporangium album]
MSSLNEHDGPSPANLVATVRAVLPSLTPAAQAIARFILDDPGMVARSTITEFSAVSGTSEATIVRTARALGFAGYSQLRFALAAAVAHNTPERLVPGDLAPDDPLTDVIAKVTRAESQALADTAAQLSPDTLGAIVDAAVTARRIDVYGVGASGLVAVDMAQKLMRIGLSGHSYTDAHLALTGAALARPGDLIVGVSCTGETPDVILPVKLARDGGATTVAITNNPRSTLAALADHVLVSAGRETAFRPGALASRISQLLIVDCIFVGIAQRTFETSDAALRATRQALATYLGESRRRVK